jgi:hypothetical protein
MPIRIFASGIASHSLERAIGLTLGPQRHGGLKRRNWAMREHSSTLGHALILGAGVHAFRSSRLNGIDLPRRQVVSPRSTTSGCVTETDTECGRTFGPRSGGFANLH